MPPVPPSCHPMPPHATWDISGQCGWHAQNEVMGVVSAASGAYQNRLPSLPREPYEAGYLQTLATIFVINPG